MKLIADCGSTTTKWAMVGDSGAIVERFTSPGMNASLLSPDDLHTTLLCSLPSSRRAQEIDTVHFYAAGCRTGAQRATIADALGAVYPKARIYVDGDLIAAARALCGHNEGIACIMGTGSNCCLYSPDNGGRIVRSISPLGYVLGDEGSGSAIGRRLVADALRGILPDDLCQAVMQFAGTDATGIIEHIYPRHDANRFLASFARLASDHIDRPEIEAIDDIHRAQPYAATRLRHTSDRLLRIHRRQLHATTRSRARTPRPQSLRHRGLANAWTDTIPCLPTEITITHISLKPIQL